jgi:hypothetical protein
MLCLLSPEKIFNGRDSSLTLKCTRTLREWNPNSETQWHVGLYLNATIMLVREAADEAISK